MSKIQYVIKRSGAKVPFTPERITNAIYRAAVAVGGRDRSTAEGLCRQVVETLEANNTPDYTPTIEEIQDVVEKILIENGHAKVAKAYILYRNEQAKRRMERAAQASTPSENIPWAKIWHVLDWAARHDLDTVDGLNRRMAGGEIKKIIDESEKAYNEDVENAAEMVASKKTSLKVVIISGPSSSGKTTTTIKLGQRLKRIGLSLVTLNVDNYFFDLEMHPKDEFGDYDFETPQALDLPLINEHLQRLIKGEEVKIPFYDFKTGKRFADQTPMRIGEHDIILIDSLHGLYADMTRGISSDQMFKLYLEPLMQIRNQDGEYVRWTDIRLIRRMLRDASHRAYDPTKTLEHWHYVRSSELRNIIPYHNTTDYIINTAMPYELPIYTAKMVEQFKVWVDKYRGDPLREDAFTRANRVYKLLSSITPLQDDSIVPPDSVIREFIGGSCLEY